MTCCDQSILSRAITSVITSLTLMAAAPSSNALAPLEEVVVVGTYFNGYKADSAKASTRMDLSVLETPQSVNVISDIVINEQLATTLGEVLSNDASITAGATARNREVFSLRGFELSSSTGYLRDGHQHWSHYQQPIEILERVEVIKGPSSTLYGQSGPGGLVNMVSKKPTVETQVNTSFDYDQEGSYRLMLDAGGSIYNDGELAYRLVLVDQEVDYSRVYSTGEERSRDRTLGSIVLDWQATDSILVRTHYDNTSDKAGLDSGNWLDAEGHIIGDDSIILDASWAFTDISVKNIGIDIITELNDEWSLTIGYNHQDFDRERFESSPRACTGDGCAEGEYLQKPYDRHDDWLFQTAFIDLVGKFDTGALDHTFLIGANGLDYYYGQLIDRGNTISFVPGDAEPTRPDLDYHNDDTLYESEYQYYGIYAQDIIAWGNKWELLLGGRNDWVDKEGSQNDTNHFLPRAALTYHPSSNSSVYYSYSESFEPGSAVLVNETDANNGMSLDPIQGQQSEIGAKLELFDARLLITGAVFDIERVGTLITEVIEDPNFETITQQAGVQRHKGAELSASGSITDRIFVLASTTYIDAEYERDMNYQGLRPIDTPEWSTTLWSRYELPHNVSLNAGLFFVGDRYADSSNTVVKDDYTRVDVGVVWSPMIKNLEWQLRLNIENLFDTEYLAGGGMNSTTVGEGRFAKVAVSASF